MTPRSWLFVPAEDEAKLAKAWAAGADAVILDLEDSVALERKPHARALALEFLKARPKPRETQAWVRINPMATGLAEDDLTVVVLGAPDGIVLPKPDSAADVEALSARLDRLEQAAGLELRSIRILPIVTETPRALFSLGSYADLPPGRLAGLSWGAEDLAAAVGAETNRAPDGGYTDLCRLARSLALAGAAAAGVAALETVYLAYKDIEGLAAYAEQGRREGFVGMLAIHPAQVETINRVFTPSEQALEQARLIVKLFAANPGAGVLSLDGQMIDAPHLKHALKLLDGQ
jgi:citrate lyase subunit beta/citryl-CoA lyase